MRELIENINRLKVCEDISERDSMARLNNEGGRRHYFFVGRANLFTIYNILNIRLGYCGEHAKIEKILDYGCGYGRVTRWLRAAFPETAIVVTDVNKDGAAWCAEKLSCERVGLELPNAAFDFIWVGSVFTHLMADVAERLLDQLLSALRPNGVLAITTHGRPAVMRMENFDWANDNRHWMHFNLGKERFGQAAAGYREHGYGYVNYQNSKDYGICIAPASWYSERALRSTEIIQILFQERADNRQDVSAFLRSSAAGAYLGPPLWIKESSVGPS